MAVERTQDGSQARTMPVPAGLFVLRYASSTAGSNPPLVTVEAVPQSGVEIVTGDFAAVGAMASPGEGLVVRAARSGTLSVRMQASRPGGSNHAHLVLERINSSAAALRQVAVPAGPATADPADILILAHVSRRGDVVSTPGEWICGPALPMAIEGLEIRWPGKPTELDLVVSGAHLVAGRERALQTTGFGGFLGSRGKAAPLTALTLSLADRSGRPTSGYALRCEALFLGTQVQVKTGSAIELAGPTRLEPLVGLKLSLARAETQAVGPQAVQHNAIAPAGPVPIAPAITSVGSSGRVRVFRTSRSRLTPSPTSTHTPLPNPAMKERFNANI